MQKEPSHDRKNTRRVDSIVSRIADERAITAAHSGQHVLAPARQYVHALRKHSVEVTAVYHWEPTPGALLAVGAGVSVDSAVDLRMDFPAGTRRA